MFTFKDLQEQHKAWRDKNFPGDHNGSTLPILGVMEELGELSHAVLKHEQGIRGFDNEAKFKEAASDAVADIIVFLTDFCTNHDIDLQSTVESVWKQVKERNWVDRPETG